MPQNQCKIRVCDCYHKDSTACWHCSRNENPQAPEKLLRDSYISNLDKVNELFKYLTDEEIPAGIHVKSRPKLSSQKAWNLIWFLQEVTLCLPDHIERCGVCGELYDSDNAGFWLDDQYELNGKTLPKKYWGSYCSDSCAPNVNFSLK